MANPFPLKKRGAHKNLVVARQERVARLFTLMYTVREMQAEMADPDSDYYIFNPHTGQPYSIGTIQGDIDVLRTQSVENASADMEAHRVKQLAMCMEGLREAWREPVDLYSVEKFMKLWMKLTGTDTSITLNQINFNQQHNTQNNIFIGEDGEPRDITDMSDEELRLIAGIDEDVVEGEIVKPERPKIEIVKDVDMNRQFENSIYKQWQPAYAKRSADESTD